MTGVAAVASVAAGTALVLTILRDVFHELFHPLGAGSISHLVQQLFWRVFRRLAASRQSALLLAGPTTMVAIVATWGVLLVVGWALVFWPFLPGEFRFASPLVAVSQAGFADALYFSSTALTTLGFGDMTPTDATLRLLVTAEAAVGFAWLTAGISWLLSIYPVLARRRTLAQRLFLLDTAGAESGHRLADLEPRFVALLLMELAGALAQVRVDLIQSAITYYFADSERRLSLSAALPLCERLAQDGLTDAHPDLVRFAAVALREAVRSYAETVRLTFLHTPEGPLDRVLAEYAAAHHREPPAT